MWPMPLCGPFGCLSVRHICVDCRARLDFCGNVKTVTYDIVHVWLLARLWTNSSSCHHKTLQTGGIMSLNMLNHSTVQWGVGRDLMRILSLVLLTTLYNTGSLCW